MPWSTNLRFLAPRIVGLLNARRPPGVPPASAIAVLEPPQLPDELVEQWADLAGADLADQIRPHSLTDWGQELVTEAESAQARDLLAHRAPAVLARLRAVLPETSIVRLGQSRLRAVWVLVASAPGFSDQQVLENALMEVWHDVTQAFGPEHELRFVHASETAADRMVEAWVTAVADVDPTRPPRIDAFVSRAAVAADDREGARRRNEGLVGEQFDLCVVFAVQEDETLSLAALAREHGVPVWQHVQ
ncbi:DUF721 domain-containing protein [Streptomyces sp. NBC_01515]|uniref:DciA family protein n=1 Tax=Streptomyces sp. NBC_01515 TaxID=2903890 RepID=UPI00386772FD